jgi:hypothetical protein
VRARLLALTLLVGLCLILAGCRAPIGGASMAPSRTTASTADRAPSAPQDEGATDPDTSGAKLINRVRHRSEDGGQPAHDSEAANFEPSLVVLDGYHVAGLSMADLNGDGTDEVLVACQYSATDSVGEPKGAAYIAIARWTGSEWEEWMCIGGESNETIVDDSSFVRAGDLNGDGKPELILRLYGFGVSGRPENVYVLRLLEDQSEPCIVGGMVELTSQDGFVVAEVDSNCPGPELLFANVQPSDGPEAGPHRFAVEAWGWSGDTYDYVSGQTPSKSFASGEDAIKAVYGV